MEPRIAVVGGTGLLGRHVMRTLSDTGAAAVALSRSTGVDLASGAGLADALRDVDVVVETSKVSLTDTSLDIVATTVASMENLLAACEEAGVRRIVHTSINGIDHPGLTAFSFYEAKRAQERLIADRWDREACVVRSAQWYEFALSPAAVTETSAHVEVQDWLVQPVAVASVGRVLAQLSVTDRSPAGRTVMGPDVLHLPELTRRVLAARGDARSVRATEPSLTAFGDGALLAPPGAQIEKPGLDDWLAATGGRWN